MDPQPWYWGEIPRVTAVECSGDAADDAAGPGTPRTDQGTTVGTMVSGTSVTATPSMSPNVPGFDSHWSCSEASGVEDVDGREDSQDYGSSTPTNTYGASTPTNGFFVGQIGPPASLPSASPVYAGHGSPAVSPAQSPGFGPPRAMDAPRRSPHTMQQGTRHQSPTLRGSLRRPSGSMATGGSSASVPAAGSKSPPRNDREDHTSRGYPPSTAHSTSAAWSSQPPGTQRGYNANAAASARSDGGAAGGRGDIALCVRVRPGVGDGDFPPTCWTETTGSVRLRAVPGCRNEQTELAYRCDLAMGDQTTQEQVYERAVLPIVESVLRGYNGAVIAYGQTGSGKTHTMLGDVRGKGQGIAPRSVAAIFSALQQCPFWGVEVSVLEIYNERVRDLLVQGPGIAQVDIHEVRTETEGVTFRCPEATARTVHCAEDALVALQEGMRRRETARTDMNHTSSRSHLIFTLCVSQSDREAGATLRSRLHLVDLAGSERLKRSMASEQPALQGTLAGTTPLRQTLGPGGTRSFSPRSPRDQRREAGEINRSLSQLALVIQRLTTPGAPQYVPYRDSMLTRLLAESFGGSSKTCVIITCSPLLDDREETKSSLEFGKRAKLVRNKPELNIEVKNEPSMVFKALVAREVAHLSRERDALAAEKAALEEQKNKFEQLYKQAAADAVNKNETLAGERDALLSEQQSLRSQNAKLDAIVHEVRDELRYHEEQRRADRLRLEQDKQELEQELTATVSAAATAQDAAQRTVAKLEAELSSAQRRMQDEAAAGAAKEREAEQQLKRLEQERAELRRRLEAETAEGARVRADQDRCSRSLEERVAEVARLEAEKTQLQRRMEEEAANLRREQMELEKRHEAERMSVHQRWHAAAAEAWSLLQERAPRVGSKGPSVTVEVERQASGREAKHSTSQEVASSAQQLVGHSILTPLTVATAPVSTPLPQGTPLSSPGPRQQYDAPADGVKELEISGGSNQPQPNGSPQAALQALGGQLQQNQMPSQLTQQQLHRLQQFQEQHRRSTDPLVAEQLQLSDLSVGSGTLDCVRRIVDFLEGSAVATNGCTNGSTSMAGEAPERHPSIDLVCYQSMHRDDLPLERLSRTSSGTNVGKSEASNTWRPAKPLSLASLAAAAAAAHLSPVEDQATPSAAAAAAAAAVVAAAHGGSSAVGGGTGSFLETSCSSFAASSTVAVEPAVAALASTGPSSASEVSIVDDRSVAAAHPLAQERRGPRISDVGSHASAREQSPPAESPRSSAPSGQVPPSTRLLPWSRLWSPPTSD